MNESLGVTSESFSLLKLFRMKDERQVGELLDASLARKLRFSVAGSSLHFLHFLVCQTSLEKNILFQGTSY